MSTKKVMAHDHRLSVNITQAMNDRLDHMSSLRNIAKAELAREALRYYLDAQEDLVGSRKFFSKSFQRRLDHVDWQLSVLLHMLTSLGLAQLRLLSNQDQLAKADLLRLVLEDMLQKGDWQAELHTARLQNHKPPHED